MYDSKKRLQPIGADSRSKVAETSTTVVRVNGQMRRGSLVMDSVGTKESPQHHSSLSQGSAGGSRRLSGHDRQLEHSSSSTSSSTSQSLTHQQQQYSHSHPHSSKLLPKIV